MTDEFDLKNSSEREEIDNFEFGFDNITEKEINRICEEQSKNEYFDNHKESKTTLLNGITEIRNGNKIYKIWKIEFIKQYIIKFLTEKNLNCIIIPEINNIDLTIFNNTTNKQIPTEIQKTPISNGRFGNSHFEDSIRRQLEDNIENYGLCWFFFDAEYHRYLQSGNVNSNTSINMTWLVKLMKEETLKVFTIKYDGIVKELTTKDFDFLKDVSQTCLIGYDNDERIINRNKLLILHNIIKNYKFTQEEIENFYKESKNKENGQQYATFFTKSNDIRCKLYGYVLLSFGGLNDINVCLDMNSKNDHYAKQYGIYLGIFEIVGDYASGQRGHHMKFVDKFDICKYFPGYLRQEKHWLTYKGNELDGKTFSNMCRGMYKKASTIFDY